MLDLDAGSGLVAAPAGAEVGGDVGPTESIDGLLGVSDGKQAPGFRTAAVPGGREQLGQFELDGIGVLELVDEDAAVPVADPLADAVVVEQFAGQHELVVELQGAVAAPLVGVPAHHRDEGVQG